MFYENYVRLCNSVNKTPSSVAVEMGIAKPTVTRWKNGSNPNSATLYKVADYFGVPVEYLLTDHSGQKENPTEIPGEVNTDNISELLDKMTTPDLINLLGEITETLKRRDEK